jgi:hypothetical protein
MLELADRLNARASVAEAFHLLPQPGVQLVEAVQGLLEGERTGEETASRAELATLLGRTIDDPDLQATLDLLSDRALVWTEDDRVHTVDPLRRAFAHPLRLGRSAVELLAPKVATDLKRIAEKLWRPPLRLKREILDDLAAWLSDPQHVAELIATAPSATRTLLAEVAANGPLITAERPSYGYAHSFPNEVNWAIERGLLVSESWQLAEMPREVALAIRGRDWHAPFNPTPPVPALVPVDDRAVRREAAVAAAAALDEVAALLDQCSLTPPALRKAGGIGARELRRLSKTAGVAESGIRLWLEVSEAAGLLTLNEHAAVVTEEYDEWRVAEPAKRLGTVLTAWLELPALPLLDAGTDDPPRPAPLSRDALGRIAVEVRRVLLKAVAEHGDGRAPADTELGPLIRWYAPLPTSLLTDIDRVVDAIWHEARLLGVTGLGALSPLGKALLAPENSAEAVVAAARTMLTAPVAKAVFQADLTAVVAGSPGPELAGLLDGCADRESRGAASVWRFSAASVRRALDAGTDGEALVEQLREVAQSGLPQALEYLVNDLARKHGTLRVRAVGCVVHSDDTGLLSEIAAARSLAALRLRLLAPTILASVKAPADTLAALRDAGYAPIGEDVTGEVVLERIPRHRAEAVPRLRDRPARILKTPHAVRHLRTAPTDPAAVAANLLAAPPPQPGQVITLPVRQNEDPQQTIEYWAPQLSRFQARLLAYAVEHGTPIRIEYTNAQGTPSQRIIEPLDLDGHLLEAWCHLREDERVFSLDRIDSVSPA